VTPSKANKICTYVGCDKIIPGTERRCKEHTEASWSIERTYDPFYSSKAWRNLSKKFRQANPLCIDCKKKGRTTIAHHADHIIPITEGGAPLDWANIQGLCRHHHASKTAKEIRQKK